MNSNQRRLDVEVVDEALGYSKAGGEQIAIRYRDERDGEHYVLYGSFSPAARKYTEDKMINSGWDGDYTNTRSMVGTKCSIVVEDEEFNGKTRTKVVFVNPRGEMLRNKMSPEQVREFAARMQGDNSSTTTFKDSADDDFGF